VAREFTRDEAEALLPHIAPLLWQARELKREHDEWQGKIAELEMRRKGNGHGLDTDAAQAQQKAAATAVQINGIIERVKGMGAEVKDIDMGLIDFRSRLKGREVYLCWKLGEEHIEWWHELNTGYAGRQPLE
jgi:hypothetical protein